MVAKRKPAIQLRNEGIMDDIILPLTKKIVKAVKGAAPAARKEAAVKAKLKAGKDAEYAARLAAGRPPISTLTMKEQVAEAKKEIAQSREYYKTYHKKNLSKKKIPVKVKTPVEGMTIPRGVALVGGVAGVLGATAAISKKFEKKK